MGLTYSFPDLESVCCSMSSSNCCFLTCLQVSQEAGQVVWYSHLLKNFPQFVHFVHFRTQEEGAVTLKETDPALPMNVQESQAEVCIGSGQLQGWGTQCSSVCMGPFEWGLHYLHYLHPSLASSWTTGREHSPTHQQKFGLKIYWAWPHSSAIPKISLLF